MLLHHARRPRAGDLSGLYIVRTSNIGFATAWAVGRATSSGCEPSGDRREDASLPRNEEGLNVLLRD